ncbi:MAG TPA: cytochrome c oxidase subunit II [Steroidobacteraceae bacterium]
MSAVLAMPPAASELATHVDALLWSVTAITATVAATIMVLLVIFCIRYRRGAAVDRTMRDAAGEHRRWLEVTWITVPFLVFLGFFFWGARLYFSYESPPRSPLQIYVVARQWMWKIEHPTGAREINELHVPRGRPVKLVMTSQDVIHSFYVPAFRVKRDVVPGRFAVLWFTATRSGVYHLLCAEYCGTDHSRMGGRIVVLEPDAYARWLESGSHESSLASRGAAKFQNFGCSGCHVGGAAVHAPDLSHLYGRTIPLADGSFVRVDERYLRDSILLPGKEIAAGYADQMPSFAGRATDEDLLELIEYIQSLAPQATVPGAEDSP